MSQTLWCRECKNAITLERTDNDTLRVSCMCEEMPIKVASKTPEEWK